ncbi:MAG: hypothetical protein JRJ84_03760 [Deltaproteobacteria bacterium]|nr:hypothetical protein [Deltaproteobacteria bacterium]
MRWMLLSAPLLLVGCGGDGFYVSGESCNTKYLKWGGGLTYHLLQGKSDGSFDYDPDGAVSTRVVGSYDLVTGDFFWGTEFHPDHWRMARMVEGYGYAATNGDLDITYSVTTTDINDTDYDATIREERVGCEVTRRTTYDTAEIWHTGTFFDHEYQYTDEDDYEGVPWLVEGVVRSDYTWTETLDFNGAGLDYEYEENGDGDGYARRDWSQISDGTSFEGYTESFLDGAEHVYYVVDGEGTWDYTVDYNGNGTGTYSEPGLDCDLTFTGGDCTYNCNGDTGSC